MFPETLDRALSQRANNLTGVKVKTSTAMHTAKIAECDPNQDSFIYNSSFFSRHDRHLGDRGLAHYIPGNFHEEVSFLKQAHTAHPNVAMVKTAPMDEKGNFNFGPSATFTLATCECADTVIIETNENVPVCLGGKNESIHISRVDLVVESDDPLLATIPDIAVTDTDRKIARFILEELSDGCCLQLGIGGTSNAVGSMIADSDLKDLGFHSEMMNDSFLTLFEKGRINGSKKNIDKNRHVYTFAMGSERLYRFLDKNPSCAAYSVDYTNDYQVIAKNDNAISINNALQVDLYGQICSESQGTRHISGTGGQLDFIIGATKSKGGKAFICLHSTRKRNGKLVSNIVGNVQGIVTVPRSMAFYVVTEYGLVNLKGKTTWERAEMLISIAHPMFHQELIDQARQSGLFSRANKKYI
jgi:acyl-CoA hydrolase